MRLNRFALECKLLLFVLSHFMCVHFKLVLGILSILLNLFDVGAQRFYCLLPPLQHRVVHLRENQIR